MWSNTDFRVWHSFSIIRLLVGSFDGWLVGLLAHPSIHPAVCPSLCLSELPAVHMFAWFVCLFIYPFMTLSFHILNYFCFFFHSTCCQTLPGYHYEGFIWLQILFLFYCMQMTWYKPRPPVKTKSIVVGIILISLILQANELGKKIGFLKTVDTAEQFGLYLLSICNFAHSQTLSGQQLQFRQQNFL